MRMIAVVQSRIGSSRLPGKANASIAGRPMLAHVLSRAKAIPSIDRVVLVTTDHERDTPLTRIADDLNVSSVRGRDGDVLSWFLAAAEACGADAVMRLTGDCPLIAPEVCERVLADYRDLLEPSVEYVSNDTTVSGFPDGTDTEVFSMRLLQETAATVPQHAPWVHGDREHVTTWMRRTQPQRVVRYEQDYRHLKLSVDDRSDLERVRRIFGYLEHGDYALTATLAAVARAE